MIGKFFVITNGRKFIRQDIDGKFQQVNNQALADTFVSQKEAKNIMLNSIPKVWSRTYYIAEIINGEIVQCNAPRSPKVTKPRSGQKYQFNNEFKNNRWCRGFEDMENIFDDALKRGQELIKEISNTDAQIVDLEHFIEFCPLNASDGYKAYKKLRELLRKRRQLKNEQKVVNTINSNHIALEHIEAVVRAIKSLDGYKYEPRIMPELFESGIKSFDVVI